MSGHLYRVHGLGLHSPIELPELAPAEQGDTVDVAIDWNGEADGAARAYGFAVPGAAAFRVEGGCRIVVTPEAAADLAAIRLFLLGSAMGVLLHQRGLMVLHANAIVVDGEAVAFTGRSGAGKSTLATAFAQGGHPVLADDVAVVTTDAEGMPWIEPGSRRVRLWNEARLALGIGDGHPRVKADMDKYTVPLPAAAANRVPFGRLYVLEEPAERFAVRPITGAEAVQVLVGNTYRGFMVGELGQAEQHWRAALAIARRVRVAAVPRAASFADLPAMIAAIRADV